MRLAAIVLAVGAAFGMAACAHADGNRETLVLERTIALPDVSGRIDHLALDPVNQRLAIAELGNGSVDILDLKTGAIAHRITGLSEPQGLGFDLGGGRLVVAEGGTGNVTVFDAQTFARVATLALGADADDVRIDPRNGHAVVGFGSGGLAVIDVEAGRIISKTQLPAHPEAFEIDPATGRTFVNLPDARTIGVVDLDAARLETHWRLPVALWNFPMARDPGGHRIAVAFRAPARLVVFDTDSGAAIASHSLCGDSDDLYYDAPRKRLYAACGSGAVDTFGTEGGNLVRMSHVETVPGARTALFSPELDRLFVAVRAARGRHGGAIEVFRPVS